MICDDNVCDACYACCVDGTNVRHGKNDIPTVRDANVDDSNVDDDDDADADDYNDADDDDGNNDADDDNDHGDDDDGDELFSITVLTTLAMA